MAAAMMNTPAPVNTGRQRAPSHSSSGNRSVAGTIINQGPVNQAKANPFVTANATSASVPSINSRLVGVLRTAAASPINRGATVIMPSTSDANQICQTLRNAAVEGPKRLIAHAAPTAIVAVATVAATKNVSTPRRLSS